MDRNPDRAATGRRRRAGAASREALEKGRVEALQSLRIIIRAAQRHSAWIEKHCGVSGAQLWVLQELHEAPGLRVGDIAERLVIHQSTASNLLRELVKKRCVAKVRDPADQRVVKLVLSRHGAAVLERAPGPARGLLPEALGKLKPEQLAQLNEGLQALASAVDADDHYAMRLLPFMM